jgi:tetratricopeptide (TPR) repeat protein
MKITKIIISILFLFGGTVAFSQKENSGIKQGNKLYDQGKYTEAEVKYREGLEKNSQSYGANFNLGNALYKQGKYDDALQHYQIAGNRLKDNDKKEKSAVFHNMGNTLVKKEQYEDGIKAYKQALRYSPNDEDTRYNLAYAQQMLLEQQQQQQNNQNQENQPNEDKQDPNKNKQQQQQQNDQNMSRENAEQILKAIEEDEKNIQEKIKLKEKKDTKRYSVEKEW